MIKNIITFIILASFALMRNLLITRDLNVISGWITNMKGVAERSSVFASEIFTAISPIPDIIHMKCYIGFNPTTFLSTDGNNKEK